MATVTSTEAFTYLAQNSVTLEDAFIYLAPDGLFQLTNANGDSIEVPIPPHPYQVYIEFPWELVELESGAFSTYDYGATYDKRRCEFSFEMTAAQSDTFNTFMRTSGASNGRAATLTYLPADLSGFHPFGPDKGNIRPFTVSLLITRQEGVGPVPFKYFRYSCIMRNTGAYVAYTLPTQVYDGGVTFGTVTQCRMPTNWYAPDVAYRYAATQTEDATVDYVDRGAGGDYYRTAVAMSQNQSKAAAIMSYIAGTARAGAMALVTPAGHYPFGRDLGDGTFSVRIAQPVIVLNHIRPDEWQMDMTLEYVSGPT